LLIAGLLHGVSSADAATQARLVDEELNTSPVRITALQDGTLSYFDQDRNLQHRSIDHIVQLTHLAGASAVATESGGAPYLEMIDGQRFSGQWIGPTPDGASLRWRHDLLGDLVVALDQITTVTRIPTAASPGRPTTPAGDTLVLSNGDTLSGYVVALLDEGVSLIPNGQADPVTIPYARIASLNLSNPSLTGTLTEHRLTLSDGTRLLASDIGIDGEGVSCYVTPPGLGGVSMTIPAEDLLKIEFTANGFQLVEVSTLPMEEVPGDGVFGLRVPTMVHNQVIQLHAPAEIRIVLPEAAVRFACEAELDTTDAPSRIHEWADMHLVITHGQAETVTGHINGDQPRVRLNSPITGRVMNIRLDPGVNGPILDRLRLRDAVILQKHSPVGRTSEPGPRPDNP